jgi:hypothetical protein
LEFIEESDHDKENSIQSAPRRKSRRLSEKVQMIDYNDSDESKDITDNDTMSQNTTKREMEEMEFPSSPIAPTKRIRSN